MNYKGAIAVLLCVPVFSFAQIFKITGRVVDGTTNVSIDIITLNFKK